MILAVSSLACATTPRGSGPMEGLVVRHGDEGTLGLERFGKARAISSTERITTQLGRLVGASVAVRGGLAGDHGVRVRSFELLDPGDGLAPMVGTVIADQFAIVIDDEITGTRLALRGAALADLREQHAARVWITGSVVGPRQVLVAHWGLLLTADEAKSLR